MLCESILKIFIFINVLFSTEYETDEFHIHESSIELENKDNQNEEKTQEKILEDNFYLITQFLEKFLSDEYEGKKSNKEKKYKIFEFEKKVRYKEEFDSTGLEEYKYNYEFDNKNSGFKQENRGNCDFLTPQTELSIAKDYYYDKKTAKMKNFEIKGSMGSGGLLDSNTFLLTNGLSLVTSRHNDPVDSDDSLPHIIHTHTSGSFMFKHPALRMKSDKTDFEDIHETCFYDEKKTKSEILAFKREKNEIHGSNLGISNQFLSESCFFSDLNTPQKLNQQTNQLFSDDYYHQIEHRDSPAPLFLNFDCNSTNNSDESSQKRSIRKDKILSNENYIPRISQNKILEESHQYTGADLIISGGSNGGYQCEKYDKDGCVIHPQRTYSLLEKKETCDITIKKQFKDHWSTEEYEFDPELYNLRNLDYKKHFTLGKIDQYKNNECLILHNNRLTNSFGVYFRIILSYMLDRIVYKNLKYNIHTGKYEIYLFPDRFEAIIFSEISLLSNKNTVDSTKALFRFFSHILSQLLVNSLCKDSVIEKIQTYLENMKKSTFLGNVETHICDSRVTLICFNIYPFKSKILPEFYYFFVLCVNNRLKFEYLHRCFEFFSTELISKITNYSTVFNSKKIEFNSIKSFFETSINPQKIISEISCFQRSTIETKVIYMINIANEFWLLDFLYKTNSLENLFSYILNDFFIIYSNLKIYTEKFHVNKSFTGKKLEFWVLLGYEHPFYRDILIYIKRLKKNLYSLPYEITREIEGLVIKYYIATYKILMHFSNCRLFEQTVNVPDKHHLYDRNPILALSLYQNTIFLILKQILKHVSSINQEYNTLFTMFKEYGVKHNEFAVTECQKNNPSGLLKSVQDFWIFEKIIYYNIPRSGSKGDTPVEFFKPRENFNLEIHTDPNFLDPKFKFSVISKYLEGMIFDYDLHVSFLMENRLLI